MTNKKLVESAWNPITLGTSKGGYTITNYAVSTSWYNKVIDGSGDRLARLRRYDEADVCSVEISRGLDILAEDVSSTNADDEIVFEIEYPDESKVNKTTIKTVEAMLEIWGERTQMLPRFFDRIRKTLKYGATFYQKNSDGSVKELFTERMIGYILDANDETKVTHYIYDPQAPLICDCKNNKKTLTPTVANPERFVVFPVDDLIVLKVGDLPFGESVIEKVYRTWKQMSLLEDAIVIYRVVRAPERRVYYIDTGNLQGPKREAAIERQRLRLMQKQVNKDGNVASQYDPHSTSEDIFIPTNSAGKGSRIETLPPGQNLGETGDLEWFAKKMAAGLRIPYSMIDGQNESQSQYTDMRVGQVYQVEIRYMGYVKRFQRYFAEVLKCEFIEFSRKRDVVTPPDMKFIIRAPASFATYKEIELNQTLLNVYNSTLSISSLSKKYALQKYLNMDQEELQYNENMKLLEKGITEEQIKKMDRETIENIVYGDGRLGKKYGIEPVQDPNAPPFV